MKLFDDMLTDGEDRELSVAEKEALARLAQQLATGSNGFTIAYIPLKNPNGHVFTSDYECDPTGQTISCENCGCLLEEWERKCE